MWVIGGLTTGGVQHNDVWSSTDGITWTEVTDSAEWSVRELHQALVFGGKMWVVGGFDNVTYKNDVWSTIAP